MRTQEAEIALAHEKTTAVVNDFRKSQKQISHIEGIVIRSHFDCIVSICLYIMYLCGVF